MRVEKSGSTPPSPPLWYWCSPGRPRCPRAQLAPSWWAQAEVPHRRHLGPRRPARHHTWHPSWWEEPNRRELWSWWPWLFVLNGCVMEKPSKNRSSDRSCSICTWPHTRHEPQPQKKINDFCLSLWVDVK